MQKYTLDVVSLLSDSNVNNEPTGFPGDKPKKMINLKATPRIRTKKTPQTFERCESGLSRF